MAAFDFSLATVNEGPVEPTLIPGFGGTWVERVIEESSPGSGSTWRSALTVGAK